jgi:isopropylmalate/homocitrate/citramalate synthase
MKIQINDCTIRDGGYLTSKDSPPNFVNGVVRGLIAGGIDFIEIGFLQDTTNGETLVYRNSVDARKYIPEKKGTSKFAGFGDNSRYSIENLDDYDGNSFYTFRLSFAKHERENALLFCEEIQKKGYKVFVQPMDAPGYSKEEMEELVLEVNKMMPYCFSIVDTFGIMYLDTLRSIFNVVNSKLNKSIRIGLHSHNNLQLSNALAEEFIDSAVAADRDIVVDASLYGMGRGAGNASTEVIASCLNSKYGMKYDIGAIFDTIEEYLIPMKSSVAWGYDLPLFICGTEKSHVDNIYHLQKNTECSLKEMYQIINSMDITKRKRYGSNYSKTDFSELEEAYKKYMDERSDN